MTCAAFAPIGRDRRVVGAPPASSGTETGSLLRSLRLLVRAFLLQRLRRLLCVLLLRRLVTHRSLLWVFVALSRSLPALVADLADLTSLVCWQACNQSRSYVRPPGRAHAGIVVTSR